MHLIIAMFLPINEVDQNNASSFDEGEDQTTFVHVYSAGIIKGALSVRYNGDSNVIIGNEIGTLVGGFVSITYNGSIYEIMSQYIRESKVGCIVGVQLYKKSGFWSSLWGNCKKNDNMPTELSESIMAAIKAALGDGNVAVMTSDDYDRAYVRGDASILPGEWGVI